MSSGPGQAQPLLVIVGFLCFLSALVVLLFGWDLRTIGVLLFNVLTMVLIFSVPISLSIFEALGQVPEGRLRPLLRYFCLLSVLPTALILIVFLSQAWLQDWVVRTTIYDLQVDGIWDEQENPTGRGCQGPEDTALLVCSEDGERRNSERDIQAALDRLEAAYEARLRQAPSEIEGQLDTASSRETAFRDHLWEGDAPLIPEDISGLGFAYDKVKSCSLSRFVFGGGNRRRLCIRRWVLLPVDATYISGRTASHEAYTSIINDTDAAAERSVGELDVEMEAFINNELRDAFDSLEIYNNRTFTLLNWMWWLSLLLHIFAWIKVEFFILARLVFHPSHGAVPIKLNTGSQSGQYESWVVERITNSSVDTFGTRHGFEQKIDMKTYSFLRGGMVPASRGSVEIPNWSQLTLSRILRGRFIAESYRPEKVEKFGAYGDANSTVLMVEIPPNCSLAIRLENLLGFTDGLSFRSHYDLRLATLLQRRILFPVIETGATPGIIYLSALDGTFRPMKPNGDSAPPEALVAFGMSGEMYLDADTGYAATYSGEFSIRPARENTFALYAASAIPSRMWRAAKRFLFFVLPLPF